MPPTPALESFLTHQPPATLVQILLELAQAHEPVAERLVRLQLADRPDKLALFEAFLQADAHRFEQADDSDGAIGDAVRCACRHWLQAAAQCETPADEWPPRLMALFNSDDYGAREELLLQAHLLLGEPALLADAPGRGLRLSCRP